MQKSVMIFFAEILFLAIAAPTTFAQDIHKYEFFGGFSYADLTESSIGWNLSGVRNISRNLGITVDVSRTNLFDAEEVYLSSKLYTNTRRYLFLAGLQAAGRDSGKWVPYLHFLAGLDHSSYAYDYRMEDRLLGSVTGRINSFAMALGGGVDYRLLGPLAFRLIHVSFIGVHSAGSWAARGKLSCGLVLLQGKTNY
jgi:hypothetical protein